MYLSRLILNPRSKQVQREIANPYEMHRTVMHAYVGRLEDAERVLFRLELHPRTGIPTLLVQSLHEPDWQWLLDDERNYLLASEDLPIGVENLVVKPVTLNLQSGQILTFRLRANPTIKKAAEGSKNGKRQGLYQSEDQIKWLSRKIEQSGGRLVAARTTKEEQVTGKLYHSEHRHDLCFLSVLFEGQLEVMDSDRLVQGMVAGIGSGKGLGFGLLSLAPAAR